MMRAGDVRALDRQLRALLAEIDAGRIEATAPERDQLLGALSALAAVLGRVPGEVTGGGTGGPSAAPSDPR